MKWNKESNDSTRKMIQKKSSKQTTKRKRRPRKQWSQQISVIGREVRSTLDYVKVMSRNRNQREKKLINPY